jgi:conjugative relaxase-like TrwC/TraI family protein
LYSQASYGLRREIEAAGERAVFRVLEAFQDLCGITRRGKQGERIERGRLAVAIFRHDTAREVEGEVPDPNLHWHTVVCNISVREDGTTGTFDARDLFRPSMKMTLGALFRTEFSKELRSLGFETYRPIARRGKIASWFEVRGVPESLMDAFSKRRKEIQGWLNDRGLFGAKAAEQATLATRRGKLAYRRVDLFRAWLDVGRKLGFTTRDVAALQRDLPEVSLPAAAKDVSDRSIATITEDWARFSELELLRASAEEAQCRGLGIADVRQLVDSLLTDPSQVVKLADVRRIPQFTTPEMLELESRLFATVRASRNRASHRLTSEQVFHGLQQHPTLFTEQVAAIRHVTLGNETITCVHGLAGTGKTFMLRVVREIYEAAGFNVFGTALAAKACQGLTEGAGIEGTHAHNLLHNLACGKFRLTRRTILVLDEAGMVGTRMMERIVGLVDKAGAKLICVGDHRQLQAIEAGAPFRWMLDELGCAQMSHIVRQREIWARDAVLDFAFGRAESALQEFQNRGQLFIDSDRDTAMRRLVGDWHQQIARCSDAIILASTRLETLLMNRICQATRRDAGELAGNSLEVAGEAIFVGDRVIFTKNQPALLVRNGLLGTVVDADTDQKELAVRLDDGLTVRVPLDYYDHLELGYAINVHRAQGTTVQSAFVLAGGSMTDRELSYVQGSRARESTRIYTDLVYGGPDVEALAIQMNRSRPKDLAHEYLREAE